MKVDWSIFRYAPWLDTRLRFIARTPRAGVLIDFGSSDGVMLSHYAEVRPDLRLVAVDVAGTPYAYPIGVAFHRVDLLTAPVPEPPGSADIVTCCHLVEHLTDPAPVLAEAARLLRPGGILYVETPHMISLRSRSAQGAMKGRFTLNFHDDPTHLRVVPVDDLIAVGRRFALAHLSSGRARNLVCAAGWPLLAMAPESALRCIAYIHWIGWSAFVAFRKDVGVTGVE